MTTSTASANSSFSDDKPCTRFLPPLYFHYKEENDNNATRTRTRASSSASTSSIDTLPSEILIQCLTQYATWGDLAKLACVQSAWKDLVKDSANHGGTPAKWELAQALLNGTHGLQRNPTLAMTYLMELAGGSSTDENDDDDDDDDNDEAKNDSQTTMFTPAMRMLASCYLSGDGVEQDQRKGLAWLEKAATRALDIDAAHQLAVIYEVGDHAVDVDVVAAAKWFRHAAKHGHVEAMAEYAMCCELGCGVEQCDAEALEWYVKAANAGHAEASYSVGEAYEEAKGVPQSDEEACLWYYKAAVMGDEDSKRALQRLSDIARIVVPGLSSILNE